MRDRHLPRLCRSCTAPMGRQQDACWSCSAEWSNLAPSGRGSDATASDRVPADVEALVGAVGRADEDAPWEELPAPVVVGAAGHAR